VSQSRPETPLRRLRSRCYDGRRWRPSKSRSPSSRSPSGRPRRSRSSRPTSRPATPTFFRIAVQGGGCSGFEYALGFDRGSQEGDYELEAYGVRVVVDPFSAPYLQGASIDFLDGLKESGFKIDNPNVSSACGCGHSFQVEDGEAGSGTDAPGDAAHGCGSGCSH
jgi:iron-sulfur cluster assembly protein